MAIKGSYTRDENFLLPLCVSYLYIHANWLTVNFGINHSSVVFPRLQTQLRRVQLKLIIYIPESRKGRYKEGEEADIPQKRILLDVQQPMANRNFK